MDRHMVSAGDSAPDLPCGEVICKGQRRLLNLLCARLVRLVSSMFSKYMSLSSLMLGRCLFSRTKNTLKRMK